MANIIDYLKAIKTAVYGEEVRGSIHDALNAMNAELTIRGEDFERYYDDTSTAIGTLETEISALATGQPIIANSASEMTNTDSVYLYLGNESGYQRHYCYIHNGTEWVAIGKYGADIEAHVDGDALVITNSESSTPSADESRVLRKAIVDNVEYSFVSSDENEKREIIQSNIRKCFVGSTAIREIAMLTLQNGEHRSGKKNRGSVLTALPYSSVFWNDSDILWNRNLSSFYSAMLNPASIVYQGSVWEIRDGVDAPTKASSTYYGTMCSGLAGKAVGNPIYYSTNEMTKLPDRFEIIEYTGADALEIGTVMLMEGHAAVVYDVGKDASGKAITVAMAEEVKPQGRITYYTVDEFEKYVRKNGYRFGKYVGVTPKLLPEVRYATDVIPEFGDRTWYKLGDTVKLYVANNSTVLYCKKNSTVFTSVTLATLPSETINGVTVYNVTTLIDEATEYYFTTDEETNYPCIISVVDCGTLTIDTNTSRATLNGYSSNLTPLYYQVNYLMLEDSSHSRRTYAYPAPSGYVSRPDLGNKFVLNGESEFTFTKPFLHEPSATGDDALYKGYSIIVHFENECGMPSINAYVLEALE